MKLDELKARWNSGADQYNQWEQLGLNEIIEFVQQECLKEAADRFDGTLPFNWVCAGGYGYSNGFDIAGELRFMAQESSNVLRGIGDNEMTKNIPITAGKRIAEKYGYDQVVIIARKVGDREHVSTFGVDKAHCEVASRMGDFFKHKLMGWTSPAEPSDADLLSLARAHEYDGPPAADLRIVAMMRAARNWVAPSVRDRRAQ